MSPAKRKAKNVLVLGGGGYIGSQVVSALAGDRRGIGEIVSVDVREAPLAQRIPDVEYLTADVRIPELAGLFKKFKIDIVVHLASIVTPGKKSNREFEYSVDVLGTENVLQGCLEAKVGQVIVTSSGAAYGYHPDSPAWLDEADPLRGNPEFAYSDHKRLVEEMLARYRMAHPELKQLIFRPGTVLGASARNQITNLFDKPVVVGLRGTDSPFVIIWDQDVVACIIKGIRESSVGIYNLAGDGILSMREMAALRGKRYVALPVELVKKALWLLKRAGITQYGPEQIRFLRYRPVLSNRRLKEEFGYTPQKTTREVFEYYVSRQN